MDRSTLAYLATAFLVGAILVGVCGLTGCNAELDLGFVAATLAAGATVAVVTRVVL